MRSKHPFSIIELLTVVLVILLLISLTIPIFVNLKMNARNAICRSNLRQLGVLLNSYQTDQEGRLPNGSINDIPPPSMNYNWTVKAEDKINNRLYANWNGHLMPYLDLHLPSKYTRWAMVTKQCTRYSNAQLGGDPNPPPEDPFKGGWVVIEDAYRVGGYQDLKVFICPEMHQNNFDVATSLKFNGIRIPRVSQLITPGHNPWSAFADKATWDYQMNGALPSSYQANTTFFNGANTSATSMRLDEIPALSEKVLILEGKGTYGGLYYDKSDISGETSFVFGGFGGTDPGLSFVHDKSNPFWISKVIRFDWTKGADYYLECANKFNTHFAGKAYMVIGYNIYGGNYLLSLVSFIYPGENGDFFNKFLKDFDSKVTITPFTAYIDEPNDKNYLVGSMNVLFGDNSVATKGQNWLFNNNQKISEVNPR